MKAQLEFTVLLLHQIEKQSIDEIYEYFEGSISIEYILIQLRMPIIYDEHFDKILLNYLVC